MNICKSSNALICMRCNSRLTTDDVGLYRKLFDIFAKKYMCVSCMAKELSVSEEMLQSKIDVYKELGCTLFVN